MKFNIGKIGTLIACALFTVSCVNDSVDDLASIGKVAPNVYWENVDASVRAGDSVSFELQYYPMEGTDISTIDVWYSLEQQTSYSASCPLVSTFTYSVASDTTITAREFLEGQTFQHDENNWNPDKRAFYLKSKFPTSYTLGQTVWANIEVMDSANIVKFQKYFPAGFAEAFRDSIYAKSQVSDFKKILTGTNPRYEEEEFMKMVDSVYNTSSGRYDFFFKDQYVEDVKKQFYSIPTDSLFYDATTMTYKLSYEQGYQLKARARATSKEGTSAYAEEKIVTLN